ncbi:beta-lactamase/transpeptidase-like protein, partial [Viridothelium virens]
FVLAEGLTNCPTLGPVFPAPRTLNTNSLQDVFQNLTETLNHAIATGNGTHGAVDNNTAYSVQFFSLIENMPAFEWYYTPAPIQNASFGTKKIDGDSIFRIGSLTKLFTVYALLLELGDIYWDEPVTKFLPELQKQSQESLSDAVDFVRWDDVTLGALASHLAGVTRDLETQTSISTEVPAAQLAEYGLPPLSRADLPLCVENATAPCNRSEFLAALATRQPTYAPNTTPIYSNSGFQILAYALEAIVGRPLSEILRERMFSPLFLSNTSTTAPVNDSRGVIPGDPGSSGWNYALGKANGYSGIYTTASDIVKVGKSILNSTLLDPNITRAWLKPVVHTSSLALSVGRPWEIARQALNPPYEHVVDIYTKTGDEETYSSLLALIPDYNAGWVSLASGPGQDTVIDEIIVDAVIPHLEAAAREQAHMVFGGRYTASNLNSSLTIGTNPNVLGLQLTEWISNGSDILEALAAVYGNPGGSITVVLQPTDLEMPVRSSAFANATGTMNGSSARSVRKVAFRAIYEVPSKFTDSGVIAEACTSWFSVDGLPYGDFADDEFLIAV